MITPHTGPIAKVPISAGSSERSILINAGMNGTEKSKNIRMYATAESMAVTVKYLIFTFSVFVLFAVTVCVLIVTRLLFLIPQIIAKLLFTL